MSWKEPFRVSLTATEDRITESASSVVRQVVRSFSLRGKKIPHAMEDAAVELRLSPRKIRALYNSELTRVRALEYTSLLDRFIRYLDREASDLRDRAARLEDQRAELEAALCLECSSPSALGGPCAKSEASRAALNEASDALRKAARKRAEFDAVRAKARGKD